MIARLKSLSGPPSSIIAKGRNRWKKNSKCYYRLEKTASTLYLRMLRFPSWVVIRSLLEVPIV